MSRSGAFQYPFAFTIRQEVSFASFVCTEDNAALVHFLRNFATSSERLCLLHGAAGSGKTHLLQALCQHNEQAVYLPLRQLLPYGPATLDGLDGFALLVLDDVQVLAGHTAWEHRLFELFNAVHAGAGRLCLAAERPAAMLPLQLADLRSRLQLCVPFEVHDLDDVHKAELLRQTAAQRGLELREEVAQYILQRSSRNMHELLEVLDRLDRQSLAEQRRLTLPFVKACMEW